LACVAHVRGIAASHAFIALFAIAVVAVFTCGVADSGSGCVTVV
jgi:hypothetical protein